MSKVMVMDKVWAELALPGPHGGCHCTGKNIVVCVFPLQRARTLIGLSRYIILYDG